MTAIGFDTAPKPYVRPRRRVLGKGWQHTVYDLGNGRVFKRPRHALPLLISVSRSARLQRPLKSRNVIRETHHLRASARGAIRVLASRIAQLDPAMLANPRLYESGAYEQDRVVALCDHMAGRSMAANKRAIDAFIRLQLSCWEYGFGDPGFDFLINSGVDGRGEAVQIDLGELSFDYDILARAVAGRIWLGQDSYCLRLTDPQLKTHFASQMADHLTPDTLAAHWGRALKAAQPARVPNPST